MINLNYVFIHFEAEESSIKFLSIRKGKLSEEDDEQEGKHNDWTSWLDAADVDPNALPEYLQS